MPVTRVGRVRAPQGLVAVVTAAAFLVFAQAFMIAPILPRLARSLGSGIGFVGLAVPAYLIPYGLTSLVWGPIADQVGRRPVIVACLAVFVAVTAATATAATAGWFVIWRVVGGVVAGGVVPVSLALIADVVPYEHRGHVWVPRTHPPSSGDHPVLVDESAQVVGSSEPGDLDHAKGGRGRI